MGNDITIRKASDRDLEGIITIYNNAISVMEKNGIHQWDNVYPNAELLHEDILNGHMYLGEISNQIAIAFVLNQGYEEEYEKGDWQHKGDSFYVLHRLCVNPLFQGKGVAKATMLRIEDILRKMGVESIRLDAFSQNPAALKLYENLGYKMAGTATWRKGLFFLFEKIL